MEIVLAAVESLLGKPYPGRVIESLQQGKKG
jgi:hypothetical protein